MIKTILFDFDGTIADSLSVFVDVYNQLSDKYGYEKAESSKIFRDHSTFQFITRVIKVPFYRLPLYYFEAKKVFKDRIDEAKPFEGIKSVLDDLSEEYELGILTSNYEESVKDFVRRENIDDFSFIHSNVSVFGKHRAIKKVLKERDLNKDETIYIGDEIRDVKACKKIGVKVIAVSYGFDNEEILKKSEPDYLIDEVNRLQETIRSATNS